VQSARVQKRVSEAQIRVDNARLFDSDHIIFKDKMPIRFLRNANPFLLLTHIHLQVVEHLISLGGGGSGSAGVVSHRASLADGLARQLPSMKALAGLQLQTEEKRDS
jgi:hypothetical protein